MHIKFWYLAEFWKRSEIQISYIFSDNFSMLNYAKIRQADRLTWLTLSSIDKQFRISSACSIEISISPPSTVRVYFHELKIPSQNVDLREKSIDFVWIQKFASLLFEHILGNNIMGRPKEGRMESKSCLQMVSCPQTFYRADKVWILLWNGYS